MFDLKYLDRWEPVAPGMRFPTPYKRKVRLEVLSEGECKLYVSEGGQKSFIGRFEGYDVVQFSVNGPFELTAKGDPVKVWCSEFDTMEVVVPDARSFTRIAERKARNPELERMMQRMRQNMEQRLQQAERDIEAKILRKRDDESNRALAGPAGAAAPLSDVNGLPPEENSGSVAPAEAEGG